MSRDDIKPFKVSKPRAIMTPAGAVMIDGPFSDDFTRLNYTYEVHRDGETARFRVAGLEVYVVDQDGDGSIWLLKDCRTRKVLAEGSDYGFNPDHFFICLVMAERALRGEVDRRKAVIREARR